MGLPKGQFTRADRGHVYRSNTGEKNLNNGKKGRTDRELRDVYYDQDDWADAHENPQKGSLLTLSEATQRFASSEKRKYPNPTLLLIREMGFEKGAKNVQFKEWESSALARGTALECQGQLYSG